MPKFATEIVTIIKAREVVEQLVIDGIRVLDAYKINIAGTTYEGEFNSLFKYIEYAANGNSLPEKKIRKYKGAEDDVTEYEFKSKHLRLWAIQQPNKKLIVFGGFKNSQDADGRSFRALKKQYVASLKK